MFDVLLKPGALVVSRNDREKLLIWKSHRCDINDDVDTVKSDEILLITKARRTTKKECTDVNNPLTDEWKIGTYRVLTPRGIVGWVGAGWVTSIDNTSII